MVRSILCVGTIWDLDDYVYPELDMPNGMTAWNRQQIVKYQLISNRKEMERIEEEKARQHRIAYANNEFGLRMKRFCGSCQHKCISPFGQRTCELTRRKVERTDRCRYWLMSFTLAALGKETGIVKDIVTKEVILK